MKLQDGLIIPTFINLNKAICLEELKEIKAKFFDLLSNSPELQALVQNLRVEYNLEFDDYGKASILVCTEKIGNVTWYVDLK